MNVKRKKNVYNRSQPKIATCFFIFVLEFHFLFKLVSMSGVFSAPIFFIKEDLSGPFTPPFTRR